MSERALLESLQELLKQFEDVVSTTSAGSTSVMQDCVTRVEGEAKKLLVKQALNNSANNSMNSSAAVRKQITQLKAEIAEKDRLIVEYSAKLRLWILECSDLSFACDNTLDQL